MRIRCIVIGLGFLISGCGSNESQTPTPTPILVQEPIVIPKPLPVDNSQNTPYSVLFYGNSHSGPIPSILIELFDAVANDSLSIVKNAPGSGYLADRLNDGYSFALLSEQPWTHVVFQAQKYSQSQGAIYPTTAAESWIANAKAINATPILFPEHPQKDNTTEGQMLQTLHAGIAEREPACVAPVGLVWNEALLQKPSFVLHSDDGNHANHAGNVLTALVFYEVISGQFATSLPYIETLDIDKDTQAWMKQVVSSVLASKPACPF
jgi:hypothetical protein